MKLEYDLEDSPPLTANLVLGLQWALIAISTIVILGKIVGSIHLGQSQDEILYLQKLFFLTGATLICQLLWGHRLPLISGPAAVLLIGIVSSQGFRISVINTSMMIGGVFVAVLAATGLFSYIRRLFTARVICVVLLLIVFTLAPTIRDLMIGFSSGIDPLWNITFAIFLAFAMFLLNRVLSGIWKTGLILFSMLGGSVVYFLIFSAAFSSHLFTHESWVQFFFENLTLRPVVVPGVLLSFLICYLALTVNDLGSIQSLNAMLDPDRKDRRITRGVILTGISNAASGFLGVLGPVNYALSPGVIASTRCASRYPLIVAGIFVLLLAPFPRLIGWLGCVPSVVVGGIMVYIMASQVSAGLQFAFQDVRNGEFSFDSGIIIGLPVLLGNIISFLPEEVLERAPDMFQPVLGNGFVAGVFAVLFLEHIVYKK
ncbi:MAG: purine/pyrimidine permease [Acidobacteria bacterium]|nr:purine/pyrimidine permease [Acidobacteriota bacterium]